MIGKLHAYATNKQQRIPVGRKDMHLENETALNTQDMVENRTNINA